jgi:peroxiredoxin
MTTKHDVPAVDGAMPDIALQDANGRATTLSSIRGAAATVVYFLRSSSCPACIKHARILADLADADQLGGAVLVLITPGEAAEAAELASRVPSSKASKWASGTAHTSAGLGKFLFLQHSGTFVINADGTVRYRRTATLPFLSMDRAELLGALGR